MQACKQGFISSAHLLECFSIHVPARSTRGAPVTLFSVPSASSRWSRVNTVVNSLFVRGPRLLNDLMKVKMIKMDFLHKSSVGSELSICIYISSSAIVRIREHVKQVQRPDEIITNVRHLPRYSGSDQAPCHHVHIFTSRCSLSVKTYMYISLDLMCACVFMVYMRLWMCFYLTTSPVIGYLPVWW